MPGYTGDGGLATEAEINGPQGIALDTTGNIYIGDLTSIRKINTSGVISTVAGSGSSGFSGDGGLATSALLSDIKAIVIDKFGNIIFADAGNNRIRKINTSGFISSIVGTGTSGYFGDGVLATAAKIWNPGGIDIDTSGNLYICERSNVCIRKVNTSGIISTICGIGGVLGYSGDGGPATSATMRPWGMRLDRQGNIYISDWLNNRIRKIDNSGIINTIAGDGTGGYSGDGCGATVSEFNQPVGITVDSSGNIYIGDTYNFRIRKISKDHVPLFSRGHSQTFTACENFSAAVDTLLTIGDIDVSQSEAWTLLLPPSHGAALVSYSSVSTGVSLTPVGLTYTPTTGFIGNDTFKVVATDCAGIKDTTTIYVTVVNCALQAHNRSQVQEGLSVLPNPALGGVFTVNLFSSSTVPVNISITNLVGKQVQEIKSETNKETEVHLDVPPGIYFLNAITSTGNYTAKIVVK